MKLVLIESPGKKQKWQKHLGSGYRVMASMGHVVELAKDGSDALGFDLDGDRVNCRFIPRGDRGKKVLRELKEAVKSATEVLFATDPDREGEIISWHLARELKVKNPTRVVTSEITAAAIKKAITASRPIDQNLVNSALGRTCLDKLVGFRGSPLVWSLNNGAKSVGRVQSATLHLICQREREIKVFVPEDYWSVYVDYVEGFRAFYAGQDGSTDEPEAEETDDAQSPNTSKVTEGTRVKTQELADQLVAIAKSHPHQVVSVQSKITFKQPPAAFTTSSLQQAAGARLKFNPESTMRIAQKLYEAGYITYMRTDSSMLSDEFCAAVRLYLTENDPENVPQKVAKHKQAALSQEAHEAIRPTEVTRLPSVVEREVTEEEARLYDLIWRRSVASQCQPARLLKTKVLTKSGSVTWKALGQILQFEGYLRYWRDIGEDQVLPTLQDGQPLTCKQAAADKKQTVPPPRYSESKLIQLMEKQGIGRPSTYSPTVKTLKERDYVSLQKSILVPTQLGMEVDQFLSQVLPELISADFTAKMERELDAIASGQMDWEKYLTRWNRDYFAPALSKAQQTVKMNPYPKAAPVGQDHVELGQGLDQLPVSKTKKSYSSQKGGNHQVTDVVCPKCNRFLVKVPAKSAKVKAGHFLSCDQRQGGCETVMFMNDRTGKYELPAKERPAKSSTSKSSTMNSHPQASTRMSTQVTEMICPKCSRFLVKVPSKSTKVKAGHFLSCDQRQGGCGTVMFKSDRTGEYELPYSERSANSSTNRNSPVNPNPQTSTKITAQVTEIICPKCNRFLVKVPAKSPNVKAGHFLSCDQRQGGCGTVMFKSDRTGEYELPYSERSARDSETSAPTKGLENVTDMSCPVCSSPLEKFGYSDKKTGEPKTMLRCSNTANRQGTCKEVAFWWTSQGHWWSKEYGEIGNGTPAKQRKPAAKKQSSAKRKSLNAKSFR